MTIENDYQVSVCLTAPAHDRLLRALEYDRETGLFIWKIQASNRSPIGSYAGSPSSDGTIRIALDGERYKAHKLAWYYIHGEWVMVDHKDRIRHHNWIDNLRPATRQLNMANRSVSKANALGVKSVYQSGKRFKALIGYNGVTLYIGTFDTVEEAQAAYLNKAKELYGEFACVG